LGFCLGEGIERLGLAPLPSGGLSTT
jgi:hypothetical protein